MWEMLANMTEVSDVAPGPLVTLMHQYLMLFVMYYCNTPVSDAVSVFLQ
jgi:hypothetical protein